MNIEEFMKESGLPEETVRILDSEIKMSLWEFFLISTAIVKFARNDNTKDMNEMETVISCIDWNTKMAKKRGK